MMDEIQAYDGDGHVEEWEATFSDDYLEPRFRVLSRYGVRVKK